MRAGGAAGPVGSLPAGNSATSAWRVPDGQSRRTTSAPGRSPRPNTRSAGATAGAAAEVSSLLLKLPARS